MPPVFQQPQHYLILLFILFNLFVVPVLLNNYYNFNLITPNDFCSRVQAVYNTFNGNPLQSGIWPWTREVPFGVFGDHFFGLLVFFIPFCFIFRNAEYLFILQTFIFSASIFPLFLLARVRLKNAWLGLLISLCFLLYPLTIRLLFFDFRLEYFAVFFLFWAFYFLQQSRLKWVVVFLLLAALCKQNILLVTAFFGLYMLLFTRGKGQRLAGLFIGLISVGILLIYLKVIGPFFSVGGVYDPLVHYLDLKSFLGNSRLYLGRMFSAPKLGFFFDQFKLLWFLPFLAKEIILVVPGLFQNLVSDLFTDDPIFVTVNIWHSTVLLPFIFIAFVYGLANLFSRLKLGQRKWLSVPLLVLIFSLSLSSGGELFYKKILLPFKCEKLWQTGKPGYYKRVEQIKSYLPRDKAIIVQLPLIHLFYDHERVYQGRNRFLTREEDDQSVRYVLYSDQVSYKHRSGNVDDRDLIKELIAEGKFGRVLNRDGFVLFERLAETPYKFHLGEENSAERLLFSGHNIQSSRQISDHEGLTVRVEFDGGPEEDEYLKIEFKNLYLNLRDYGWLSLDYEVEDSAVQTIEIVIGIDTNGDGLADCWGRRLYPVPAAEERGEYVISLCRLLGEQYPDKENCNLSVLEIYPHKLWGADCRGQKKEYQFKLYKVNLF